MRKYFTVQLFLLYCCLPLFSSSTLANTTRDEVSIESIKAPPRDVKDILRLVEQTKPDLAVVERAKKIIAMPVPSAQDNEELNNF